MQFINSVSYNLKNKFSPIEQLKDAKKCNEFVHGNYYKINLRIMKKFKYFPIYLLIFF